MSVPVQLRVRWFSLGGFILVLVWTSYFSSSFSPGWGEGTSSDFFSATATSSINFSVRVVLDSTPIFIIFVFPAGCSFVCLSVVLLRALRYRAFSFVRSAGSSTMPTWGDSPSFVGVVLFTVCSVSSAVYMSGDAGHSSSGSLVGLQGHVLSFKSGPTMNSSEAEVYKSFGVTYTVPAHLAVPPSGFFVFLLLGFSVPA